MQHMLKQILSQAVGMFIVFNLSVMTAAAILSFSTNIKEEKI